MTGSKTTYKPFLEKKKKKKKKKKKERKKERKKTKPKGKKSHCGLATGPGAEPLRSYLAPGKWRRRKLFKTNSAERHCQNQKASKTG